ncbi:MAG: hypothetical protein BroJett040_22680 [Oligoflexia bacterium]|nr:MAG: hypothetical protein BroJett040_22680 [Oligoflexia bacterium]
MRHLAVKFWTAVKHFTASHFETLGIASSLFGLVILFNPLIVQANTCALSLSSAPDLWRQGKKQESIWQLKEQGQLSEGLLREKELAQTLRNGEFKFAQKLAGGHTDPNLVQFSSGIRAVWKPLPKHSRQDNLEVAAYLVDHMLGLDVVPMTVPRAVNGQNGSMQYYIADAQSGNKHREYYHRKKGPMSLRLLDYLISNSDLWGGNLLVTPSGKVIAIDNAATFRPYIRPTEEAKLRTELTQIINLQYYRKLKNLTEQEIQRQLQPYLSQQRIEALITRKDMLLKMAKPIFEK